MYLIAIKMKSFKKSLKLLGMVAHAYNPSY